MKTVRDPDDAELLQDLMMLAFRVDEAIFRDPQRDSPSAERRRMLRKVETRLIKCWSILTGEPPSMFHDIAQGKK